MRWPFVLKTSMTIAFLAACGGATDTEVDDEDVDLPQDFDTVSQDLAVDPTHEASGEHDRECGHDEHDGKHKRGKKRLHHLFKRLDRLDGEKDKRIVIAALPDRLPDRLIAKLRAIDTNGDGVVTKEEVRAAWKDHKEARKDRD